MNAEDESRNPTRESTYVVYENRVHHRASVHEKSCRFVGQHGAVSKMFPPSGWYSGPFQTRKAAEWKADITGYEKIICSVCIG